MAKTKSTSGWQEAESIFLQRLASLPIRPSHSRHLYRVTSGAYRLKRFRREAINFRLSRNPDYYQEQTGGVDWITIKRFRHAAYAIKALLNQKIDLIPLMRCNRRIRFQMTYHCSRHPSLGKRTICCSSIVVKDRAKR